MTNSILVPCRAAKLLGATRIVDGDDVHIRIVTVDRDDTVKACDLDLRMAQDFAIVLRELATEPKL